MLASGGFNRHPTRRGEWIPGIDAAWCPGAPGHTGSAQDLALAAGAQFGDGALSPSFWAPVSLRTRADGSRAVFPHFMMDRGKPGMLTVNQAGERFVNEATSYHLFALAMQAANVTSPSIPAWLICDAAALKRYGLGMLRPGARPGSKALAPFLTDGYITQGETLHVLAEKLGMAQAALAGTVARFNASVEAGSNPCLGALSEAPFFCGTSLPRRHRRCAGARHRRQR